MLGVGIIGCGAISSMHIGAYLDCPRTQIRTVASRSESSARRAGERLDVPWYTEYRTMLDRGDIDRPVCRRKGHPRHCGEADRDHDRTHRPHDRRLRPASCGAELHLQQPFF